MASNPHEIAVNGTQHESQPGHPETSEKSQHGTNGSSHEQVNGDSPEKSQESEKQPEKKQDKKGEDKKEQEQKQPEGGYDSTPLPPAPPGFTLRITFHKAENLPMADINSFSSDPFIVAQMYTSLPSRHKEDPPLNFRTPTIRRNVDPVWDTPWIVANVPASGFRLKCRLYDEDPADHDDRLGNATIEVPSVSEHWEGINNQMYKIKKRMGSRRAYLLRAFAVCIRTTHSMDGHLWVSIENLGKTETENGSRCYTVGPMWWTKHYSPLLGMLAGRKEPGESSEGKESDKKAEKYDFQANQFQLQGPPPPELYHRYVEFKSFVKGMFTAKGISGFLLSKALHHQHARVYNFDRTTEWGMFDKPSKRATLKFLDLVHYDQGGRIFTYVLTLDSLFRFTETGKEFGIDFLSKHTMHSDVSIYIAYSGEFFIRRLKHKDRLAPEEGGTNNASHPPDDIGSDPSDDEPPNDPGYYELVIDNDSGTYRPNAKLLPKLKEFLEFNLPGLHILTLDCQKDAEKQQRMKAQQREKKEKEGDKIIYRQMSRGSSISSSDISDLDELRQHQDSKQQKKQPGVFKQAKKEVSVVAKSRQEHWKGIARGRNYPDEPSSSGGRDNKGTSAAIQDSTTDEAAKASGSGINGAQAEFRNSVHEEPAKIG